MSPLPRFIVLKSAYSGKCPRMVPKVVSTQTKLPETLLNFTGEDMAKFKVDTAEADPELVHIRCCYNNKYLTRPSQSHLWSETVAFRRSSDGKYLSAATIGGQAYLQFTTTELTDKNVKHEIIHVDNDFVRIKSIANGLLWKRSSGSNWVLASGNPNSHPYCDPNMLFLPIQLGENVVSYRSKGNQMFCKSRSLDGKRECLIASAPDMSDIAKLELVDILAAAP